MKILLLYLFPLLIFLFPKVTSQKKEINNPINDFISKLQLDTLSSQEVYKIIYDFNGDGLSDIALSSSVTWGNAGGEWHFYFQKNNKKYYYYDMLETMHSMAYSILKQKAKDNILISYRRSNCCSGEINYSLITKHGFKRIKLLSIGYNNKMDGEEVAEIVTKELSKGKMGKESIADLKCLLSKSNNCWTLEN